MQGSTTLGQPRRAWPRGRLIGSSPRVIVRTSLGASAADDRSTKPPGVLGFGPGSRLRPRIPLQLAPTGPGELVVGDLAADPRRSHDRRRRGLHHEVLDHKAELAFLEELGKLSDGRGYREQAAERRATAGASYQRDARALGVGTRGTGKEGQPDGRGPEAWVGWVSRHGADYARIVVAGGATCRVPAHQGVGQRIPDPDR